MSIARWKHADAPCYRQKSVRYDASRVEWNVEFHITWFGKHKEKTFENAENYSSSSTNRGGLPRMLLRGVSFNASHCPPKRPESRRNSTFPDRRRMPLSLATRRVHSFPRLFPWTRPRKQSAWKQSPGQSPALHSNQVGRLSERLWRTNRPTVFLSSCSVELTRDRERQRATLDISWSVISFGIQFPEICSWVPLDRICCLYVCEYKKYLSTRVISSSLLPDSSVASCYSDIPSFKLYRCLRHYRYWTHFQTYFMPFYSLNMNIVSFILSSIYLWLNTITITNPMILRSKSITITNVL